jgi:UDP-glucose 4-epimerase
MTILITEGAGYIGGHAVLALLDRGFSPIILDDLSIGASSFVPEDVPLLAGDIGDNNIDTILHFAAKVDVAESIANPLDYHLNNTIKAQSIIQVEGVTDRTLQKHVTERRIGGPVSLVSDNRRLVALGWKPQFDNLSAIVEHARNWQPALAKRTPAPNGQLGTSP